MLCRCPSEADVLPLPRPPGSIEQPTRWGMWGGPVEPLSPYRQSSTVGPNACTLQMDHLPTEDGGGSHFANEWYDVVHFYTIFRNSVYVNLQHGTNP